MPDANNNSASSVVSGFTTYRELQNYFNAIKVMIGDNLTLCRHSPLCIVII